MGFSPRRRLARTPANHPGLPVGFAEVFQEFAPDMLAGVEPRDDRVHDTGGSIDDIQRWVKLMSLDLASSDDCWIFVSPARIDSVHVNAVGVSAPVS